jgi:hypothetical protein
MVVKRIASDGHPNIPTYLDQNVNLFSYLWFIKGLSVAQNIWTDEGWNDRMLEKTA